MHLGRMGEFRTPDPAVTRRHARLEVDMEGRVSLIDLGSTNGTFLNGLSFDTAPVVDGDRIQVGTTIFEVSCEARRVCPLCSTQVRGERAVYGFAARWRGSGVAFCCPGCLTVWRFPLGVAKATVLATGAVVRRAIERMTRAAEEGREGEEAARLDPAWLRKVPEIVRLLTPAVDG